MTDEQSFGGNLASSEGENYIVWLDCEMTGLAIYQLGPEGVFDEIIEIGVLVTDGNLTPVNDGINLVVKPSDVALKNMNSFVSEMHKKSGLLDRLDSGIGLSQAEEQVINYLRESLPGGRQSAPMAGNSITMDRRFIAKYMPRLDDFVHYRSIDVTAIKELVSRWFPEIQKVAPSKTGNHRALSDAVDSLRELAYYRELLFNVSYIDPKSAEQISKQTSMLYQGIGS